LGKEWILYANNTIKLTKNGFGAIIKFHKNYYLCICATNKNLLSLYKQIKKPATFHPRHKIIIVILKRRAENLSWALENIQQMHGFKIPTYS